jgi:ribosome-binding factor A
LKKPVAAPTQRQLRVAEQIRHLLSEVFARGEFRAPYVAVGRDRLRFGRRAPDLKRATAFVARLGRTDVDKLMPALKRAAPYLRGEVAKSLRMKYAPDLSFQPDTALEYATKIDRLMRQPEVARDLDPT